MIKNFENYTKRQRIGGGYTQWEKSYEDGQTAWVCVDDTRVTRALVRSAFVAQENNLSYGAVFTHADAENFNLSH